MANHYNAAVKDLERLGKDLFSKKTTLNSLWQEMADNFYPERADFTYKRYLGDEFAEHLMDSYPSMVRRDLANSFSSMLRPTAKEWFEMRTTNFDEVDHAGKQWLEWANGEQKKRMYDRKAKFNRATKEGDNDFATFGQTVIHVDYREDLSGLIFKCYHLRDMAWIENNELEIDCIFRKYKAYACDLNKHFKGNISPKIVKIIKKEPYREIECMHMIVPQARYHGDDNERKLPYVSIHLDIEHQFAMQLMPTKRKEYVIPRWQTVSGSQYAYSPATITALPDARLIQAMTLVMLEAGEKFVNPPLVATQEVVRSDVALYAGGITWVDSDYDERLGDALRPLTTDKSGMPIGFEMQDRQKAQIHECFFLNKVAMPQVDKQATAFEIGQMVQEYIRQAMPLFEPMESDYNGQLCEETFEALMLSGALGSEDDIPDSLRGYDIEFKFESPLHDSEGKAKGQQLMEARSIMGELFDFEPSIVSHVDIHKAFRDTLEGIGIPQEWMRDEDDAMKDIDQAKQEAQMQQAMDAAGQMAEVAQGAGEADQAIDPEIQQAVGEAVAQQ